MAESGPEPLLDPVQAFAELMRRLRAQCPWKGEQTHRSLVRYLLEETHETIEAIESGDPAHLREELGDLLLQVFFHAAIAEESGAFTLDDVAREVTAKMVRRNPHVLGPPRDGGGGGSGETVSARQVDDAWHRIKAGEKQRTSVLDGLAPTLPALLLADKVLDRLSRTAPAADDRTTVPRGDGAETEAETVIGERLLALVADSQAAGVDPEQALRSAVRRLVAHAEPQPADGP